MRQESKWRMLPAPLLVVCCLCSPLRGQTPAACQTRDLTLELKRTGAASGRMDDFYLLTNRGNKVCAVSGYPSAVALNGRKKIVSQIQFKQVQPSAGDPDDWRVRTIRLEPGEHAWFEIQTQDGMGLEDRSFCGKAASVRITPPQNRQPFRQLFPFTDCVPTAFIYFLEAGSGD
jgi:hypothetical protein